MKYLALLSVLFIASCASRHQPHVMVRPAPSPESNEDVRYGEVVRPYYVGRSVDPNQLDLLEEQHPIYRVETSAQWNFHPGVPPSAILNPPVDSAFAPRPANDAIAAELNQQREMTQRVLREAEQLAQSYAALQQVIGEMKTVVTNSARLDARLTAVEQQIQQCNSALQAMAAATNRISGNTLPK